MNRFFLPFFSGLAGLGLAAAIAVTTNAKSAEAADTVNPHVGIIEAVKAAGFTTHTDHRLCRENPNYYGFVYAPQRLYVICFDNINNDTELFRTIRHEAVHVMQWCNNGPIAPFQSQAIVKRATDNGWDPETYPASQLVTEAEGRVFGDLMSAEEVVNHLNIHCN